MMRRFGLLAALAAISIAAPAIAKPGDHAKNSAVYAEFIASCKAGLNDPPNLRDEAALKLEKMSKAERELQVKGCQMSLPPAEHNEANEQVKVASSVPPAAYLGPVARTFQKMAMKRHRPQQRHAAPVAEDNYAEVREFLRAYKGPLWKTHGPDHRHMNEPPPSDAVPCRPPGSDHTMLCAPRRHP
jgi:hypothetical protein